jgi:hypothetical protein
MDTPICDYCKDTGTCRVCGGTGYIQEGWGEYAMDSLACTACDGYGECFYCDAALIEIDVENGDSSQ